MELKGWRKFGVAMAALGLSFVLAWTAKLTSDFATIVTVVVGSYQAANAATHFAQRNGG